MAQLTTQQAMGLALGHYEAGRFAEAETACRQILATQPNHAQALNLLATLARHAGRLEDSAALCRQAISARPRFAPAHNNLGNALQALGNLPAAIFAYGQAIGIKPDFTEAHYNLGIALQSEGSYEQAAAAYRKTISLRADFPQAHNNLGNVLKKLNLNGEAMASYREAIRLRANYAEAHYNLGNSFSDLGEADRAIASYREAIRCKSDFAGAYNNMGNVFMDMARFDDAVEAFGQAIAFAPDLAEAFNNLGNALTDMGLNKESAQAYERALALKPDFLVARSNLLYSMHRDAAFDAGKVLDESRRFNPPGAILQHANGRDPQRRLRIGYISPDFYNHSVSRFLLPLFQAHDRAAQEIFAYSDVRAPDAFTARLKACTGGWRPIAGVSDQRVAEMIHEDRIDILVDLAGHTRANRLAVFARKPAPVQVTWLGYPGTTGLPAMDYRFTDAYADPPGVADELCSEKLMRLPRSNWCFEAPVDASPVGPPPVIANGYVTFGSFNNFAKVNEALLKWWAEILRAVPGSRLLLKAKALQTPSVEKRVVAVMSAEGIEADRLELKGWVAPGEHLALYNRVDIALDTYPYHGTTTTCEALWMGVPAVTLAGNSHICRVGVSLLSNVGMEELIAPNAPDYVRIAVALAGDLPRMTQLRSMLRQRMRESPLVDGVGFARNVEAAYRQMWQAWCAVAE